MNILIPITDAIDKALGAFPREVFFVRCFHEGLTGSRLIGIYSDKGEGVEAAEKDAAMTGDKLAREDRDTGTILEGGGVTYRVEELDSGEILKLWNGAIY